MDTGGGSALNVGVLFGGNWRLGLLSGLFGGVAFGVIVSVVEPTILRVTVPGLYGVPPPGDVVLGWVVHVLHASAFGVAFAAVVGLTGMPGASPREQIGAALLFALGLWFVFGTVTIPVWLGVYSSITLPFPYVSTALLAGHLVYGMVMGTIYYAFDAPADEAVGVDE
jgi:hypothetical protein